MNKFFSSFKKTKLLDLNLKKKLVYYDKESNKFAIKEVLLNNYFNKGKTLFLYPYPCIKYFLIFFFKS